MKRRQRRIFHDELIGRTCEIVSAANSSLVGMKGKIVDETKNTLSIDTSKGEKKVLKSQVVIMVNINNKQVRIEGSELAARPQERVK